MKRHTNYIIEYENFISAKEADEILHLCKKYILGTPILTGKRNKNRKNDAYYLASYKSDVCVYLKNECKKIGEKAVSRYYNDCKLIRYNLMHEFSLLSNYVYRFYDVNDEYNWHIDNSRAGLQQKISFLLYLNDDFEGGNTLFLNDKLKVIPKKGSALLFPCGPYFLHKSTPVKSGQKHIIWNCFGQSIYENKLTASV